MRSRTPRPTPGRTWSSYKGMGGWNIRSTGGAGRRSWRPDATGAGQGASSHSRQPSHQPPATTRPTPLHTQPHPTPNPATAPIGGRVSKRLKHGRAAVARLEEHRPLGGVLGPVVLKAGPSVAGIEDKRGAWDGLGRRRWAACQSPPRHPLPARPRLGTLAPARKLGASGVSHPDPPTL